MFVEHLDALLAGEPAPLESGLDIGRSREGRPVRAFHAGTGPLHVSLIAGNHADEPVGGWFLLRLARYLGTPAARPWLDAARWVLIPQANPDGAAANAAWSDLPSGPRSDPRRGFDLAAYLTSAVRERPGDDLEFGYPDPEQAAQGSAAANVRPEALAAARVWSARRREHGPFHLHASLHGMSFAAGPWFLLDRAWVTRTAGLRKRLAAEVQARGQRLHDVQRHGEKGFTRIEPGFATRPDSVSMRRFFLDTGDVAQARRFHLSSMEYIRALGGNPLTLVTEMPLFTVEGVGLELGPPDPAATRFKESCLPRWRLRLARGEALPEEELAEAGVRAMPVLEQMRFQGLFVLHALDLLAGVNG
jgi:hypothetical protein